jgi:hypothetical protein
MDMSPAINSWSDLSSYGFDVMESDLRGLEKDILEGKEKPVVILGESAWERLSNGENGVGNGDESDADKEESDIGNGIGSNVGSGEAGEITGFTQEEKKWGLIQDFMIKYQYQRTFQNDTFAVWESDE